jgi:type I restriction enzyme S subunit
MRDGWRAVTFGDVLDLDIDQVAVEPGTEYPVVGVLNRGRGLLHREPVTTESTKYLKLNRVAPNQLVYSKLKAFEGAVTVAPDDLGPAFASQEFPTFTCRPDVLPDFVRLLTEQPALWRGLAAISKGMGGRRERVRPEDLLMLPMLLPSLRDQERITDLLGAIDEAIAAADDSTERSRQVLTQVRSRAMTGTGESVAASQAFDVLMGVQRSPARAAGDRRTAYLRSANVLPGKLVLADVKSMSFSRDEEDKYSLVAGDVLVTEGSGSPETVGAPAAYNGEVPGPVCFQNTLLRYRSLPGITTDLFVLHWCYWAFESGLFREVASGTNIKHIGSRRAEAMQVCLPSLERQEEVTAELDALTRVVDASQAVVDRLLTLRSHVLSALLSGEHEIPSSYDEFMAGVAV